MKTDRIALLLLLCGLLVQALDGVQAQRYRTETKDHSIKTLQVYPVNNWKAAPVINLGSDDRVLVSFDELSHDYKRYAYRIIHCDRNWKKSNLNLLEYLSGFSENDITAYGTSTNTLMEYTHYSFTLPNENVTLKLSGNYAIEVFDRDDSKKTIATACISLVDNKTTIKGAVSANTEIDTQREHQQVQFTISPNGWSIQQAETELAVTVHQNRDNTGAVYVTPEQINPDKLVYEHIQELIFEGGNEYRRFETTSFKHAGIGVNKVAFFTSFYNAELFESKTRNKGYVYDQDQNGRFLVRNTDYSSNETNSDYFLVHFSYPMQQPLPNAQLYLNGDLVENKLDESSRMAYNEERKAYEKTLFLKQGSYNYRYVVVDGTDSEQAERPSSRQTEGSYWQTENEYHIYVYYKPMGSKYDQLIGFTALRTAF